MNLPFYLYKILTKMAHQVKSRPTKIAGRISHHGLIKLIVLELLQTRNMAYTNFLFWNEFETELQPEENRKSSSKNSSTPRSGKRKRRAIYPIVVDQASLSPKTKKAKRNLDFSEKAEEVSAPDKNILNYLTLILRMKKNRELT